MRIVHNTTDECVVELLGPAVPLEDGVCALGQRLIVVYKKRHPKMGELVEFTSSGELIFESVNPGMAPDSAVRSRSNIFDVPHELVRLLLDELAEKVAWELVENRIACGDYEGPDLGPEDPGYMGRVASITRYISDQRRRMRLVPTVNPEDKGA